MSAYQFWRPGEDIEFDGLHARLITGLYHQFGQGGPLNIDHEVAQILAKTWSINCDVLFDRNIHSREAANLGLILPYLTAHMMWKHKDKV